MTDLRTAAMQQALEAMETPIHEQPLGMRQEAITALRAALAQQAEPVLQGPVRIKPGSYTLGATWVGGGGGSGGVGAPPQQAEPDHETRAELAEQQVVQLAEERDHYRNLWQKAQQAEPVDTDCHTQGICQRSGYGIGKQADPQIEDRLARHGIPKP